MQRNSTGNWLSRHSSLLRLPLIISILLAIPQLWAAGVDSISSEVLEHSGEEAYWRSTIKCAGTAAEVVIRQELKQELWCTNDKDLPCTESKIKMAEQACLKVSSSSNTNGAARQQNPRPPSQPVASTIATKQNERRTRQQAQDRQRAEQITVQERRQDLAESLVIEQQQVELEIAQLENLKIDLKQSELELDLEESRIIEQLRELESSD